MKKLLAAVIIFLLLLVAFPRLHQAYFGYFYSQEIHAFAFGGHSTPENSLEPLRILFVDIPHIKSYELFRCPNMECEWPGSFEALPNIPRIISHNKILMFETEEVSDESTYIIRGDEVHGGEVLSKKIKSKMRSEPTKIQNEWLNREMVKDEKENVGVPLFTWNIPENSKEEFFYVSQNGEVAAAFYPKNDAWQAGQRDGIKFSLFDIREIPKINSQDRSYKAQIFYADKDRWVFAIGQETW